jgi:hypothetical protein
MHTCRQRKQICHKERVMLCLLVIYDDDDDDDDERLVAITRKLKRIELVK